MPGYGNFRSISSLYSGLIESQPLATDFRMGLCCSSGAKDQPKTSVEGLMRVRVR